MLVRQPVFRILPLKTFLGQEISPLPKLALHFGVKFLLACGVSARIEKAL
jgi:hypothetical protein